MSSPSSSPDPGAAAAAAAPIPDDDDQAADLPLTMAASVVLTSLPRDAHEALEGAGELAQDKGEEGFWVAALAVVFGFPVPRHTLPWGAQVMSVPEDLERSCGLWTVIQLPVLAS